MLCEGRRKIPPREFRSKSGKTRAASAQAGACNLILSLSVGGRKAAGGVAECVWIRRCYTRNTGNMPEESIGAVDHRHHQHQQ